MKISDLIPERPIISTSIGDIHVRHLSAGDIKKLSQFEKERDFEILGNKALQILLSKNSDKSDRDGLSDEVYNSLSDTELKLLIPIAYKQCNFDEPGTQPSISSFGSAVNNAIQQIRINSDRISESFASVLNKNTLSHYTSSLEGVKNVTEKIRQSIATRKAVNNLNPSEYVTVESTPPKGIDFSRMPENRAAKATEKSAETLDKMSGLLLEMAGSIGAVTDNLMREIIPQYTNSLNESRISAARTIRLTVVGLAFSALVSVALTGWQVYLSVQSGKESDHQANEAIATLKHQLALARSAQDQLSQEFATQHQQNLQLNARLIEALKNLPAPVVNIVESTSTSESEPHKKETRSKNVHLQLPAGRDPT